MSLKTHIIMCFYLLSFKSILEKRRDEEQRCVYISYIFPLDFFSFLLRINGIEKISEWSNETYTALKVKSDFICLTENGQQGFPLRFLEAFMHTGVKGPYRGMM